MSHSGLDDGEIQTMLEEADFYRQNDSSVVSWPKPETVLMD